MDEQKMLLLATRGLIASLPEEEQKKVKVAYEVIKATVENGGQAGLIALALAGAEAAQNKDAQ